MSSNTYWMKNVKRPLGNCFKNDLFLIHKIDR